MVGVLDMLRFHQFTAGQFWRDEFGNVENADEFKTLLAYSPYHNIKDGTKYPPTLIMTADTDDRVVPMHSFKFARGAAAGPSGRRADPAAHREARRPRRRHAGDEADRNRRRSLGVSEQEPGSRSIRGMRVGPPRGCRTQSLPIFCVLANNVIHQSGHILGLRQHLRAHRPIRRHNRRGCPVFSSS